MRLIRNSILFLIVIGLGVYSLVTYSNKMPKPKDDTEQVESDGPDVHTLVSEIASAAQAQNQLLVMTSRMNAAATSEIKSMGMHATQTDIGSTEIQYFIDMKYIDQNKIFIDKEVITIALPERALLVKQLPITYQASYQNDSWLFTWKEDTKEHLKKANERKIYIGFLRDAEQQKPDAYIKAKDSLRTLFEVPLRALLINYRVEIIFNKN